MTLTTSVKDMIPRLRLEMGDIDAGSYRYLDEWLELALTSAVEALQRWWNYKYLLDEATNEVYRNPYTVFLHAAPPVIERGDIRPIILMAKLILKKGDLQNLSWNVGAWRDAEISYTNIKSGELKQKGLEADWEELVTLLTPPGKRLSYPRKSHLPGYTGNQYEHD